MSNKVSIVKTLKTPNSPGMHYRLLCMTGKNKGNSYYIKSNRIVLGRGEGVDIFVHDPKSSKEHIELAKVGKKYVLTDLKSRNGVMVNDLKVTQHNLEENDIIIIGSTVYKYNTYFNEAPKELTIVDDEEDEDEEEEEVVRKRKKKKPVDEKTKRTRMMMIVVGGLAAYLFLGDSPPPPQKKGLAKKKEAEIVKIDNGTTGDEKLDPETRDKLNALIHRGLREYREKNYFRALEEFSTALLLSPNHGRAAFYKSRTEQALDGEIKALFDKAKQDVDALKYNSAMVSYCNIMRLLHRYPERTEFKDAEANLKVIAEAAGLEENEIKCFKGN